jgi:hypothetical protein
MGAEKGVNKSWVRTALIAHDGATTHVGIGISGVDARAVARAERTNPLLLLREHRGKLLRNDKRREERS